jgi:NAD(P)H-flavin reductase
MRTGKGQVVELILEDGYRYVRVVCPPGLVPAPGQYVLASDGSESPLPLPLFHTDLAPRGFLAAVPQGVTWSPGHSLQLRGPLGRGFTLPLSVRRVGLVAFDDSPVRLIGLIRQALQQDAAVVLVCDPAPDNLPNDVEVQPLSAINEILEWADYTAFDVARENLNRLRETLGTHNQVAAGIGTQVLIRTPVPCGGVGECGVCAVTLRSEWRLACKDGPVFDWRDV